MRRIGFAGAMLAVMAISPAFGADLAGSQDPLGFKRYQGSEIVHFVTKGYAQYKLALGGEWGKTATVEGTFTRAVYLEPQGTSALEIFRNYEQAFENAGYTRTLEVTSDAITSCCDHFFGQFLRNVESANQPYYDCGGGNSPEYATYKGSQGGEDVVVAFFVSQSNGCSWGAPDFKKPIAVAKGQAILGLDVIVSKAIQNKMVVVKAADIADALAAKGVFDLYGVYFDTDKVDVKSESMATLDEVAALLKIDRSLKLEISGHTDNVGAKDHNLKLSQGRAQAVVNVLVQKYGIDPKRMVAKGYGDTKPIAANATEDGRAKNRRVELRKL